MVKWCSDSFSTLRENLGEEVDYDYYYKSQELKVFHGRQKLTSAKLKARKVMLDFKIDALYS